MACGLLGACSEAQLVAHTAKVLSPSDDPTRGGIYKIGSPYEVAGVRYTPRVDYTYDETGIASWYGPKFHGNRTANGEVFDQNRISAAHRTLPLPSEVLVTNLENGRAIRVRVNDRGPFAHGRIIDLSRRAAQLLGFYRQGTAKVRVQILPEESRRLAALYTGGQTDVQVAEVESAPPQPTIASADDGREMAAPADTPVTQLPVSPTRMYIQVGAFTKYRNAMQLQERLMHIGGAQVTRVRLDGQQFFRVRIGPVDSLDHADRTLERVIRSGYTDAQLVVDR